MDVLNILSEHYPICFDKLEQLRDGGSTSYAAFSGGDKYFLRVIKPAFFDTAIIGADIQVFLQRQDFPVPPIIFAKDSFPYVKTDNSLLILYEFIEGGDSEPERDAEAIGALIGRLHQIMKSYPGKLVKRDKHFFIGRYIDILRKKQYPRTDEYAAYGDALWNKIKDLPHGYCHGDMYDGNIRKTPGGKLYIHDFDTSCEGFPMYDTTLICNMTKYFEYDERNYDRSNQVLARFLPEYRKYSALSQEEINAFHALIAVQHFSTQATVMECFGLDCLDKADMDNQLDWLYRWREQCESGNEDDIGLSNMFTNIKDQLDNPIVRQIIAASLFDASPEGLDKWAARLRDNDDKQLYGWVKNGDIVGVCAFLPHPDKVEILNIATVENSRRRGIGGAMVTALQDIYQLPIEAETDDDAVGFYRNCGFEATAIYKQYSNDTFLRWTCVLPAPECLLQETDEERRARIYPVILSDYNPAWPEWFADEKATLERLFGDNIVGIQHIGSTAVPGLTAKPTIDILLEIKETADIDKLIAVLPSPEYICLRGEGLTISTPPPHLRFIKGYLPDGFAEKVYHIHVVYTGDEDSRNKLSFRDYLISHPETAVEYADLKRRLLKDYEHDRDGYTEAKSEFIRKIIRKARED